MKNTLRYLSLTGLLATTLSACGSKDQAETATTSTTPEAPAAATAPAEASEATTTPAAPAATFDLSTVPVSAENLGQFPYFAGLTTYEENTSNSEEYDFERAYVYDGKNLIPVEGKVSQRLLNPKNGEKKASELMIRRNYETLVTGLGGVKVFSGKVPQEVIDKVGSDEVYKHGKWSIGNDHETDTYVIRQKDKEVWVQVTALGATDANYNLTVTERAAMPQQAAVIPAQELKKN
ncbi:hypothetical protein FY528_16255 [Hymenobacter lutimineralis]|uniref:Lipoprotein n=1 Tax=Hymenobacter lutimineralis TaxID=2606448 RepID=A0A5D6UX96_9BACT|nr:hypothetical protein [Hymenobacter lutimineralis]TYZ07059.1 hypothetical protein FY528_16255 [Hymenobacter lutimineralis]